MKARAARPRSRGSARAQHDAPPPGSGEGFFDDDFELHAHIHAQPTVWSNCSVASLLEESRNIRVARRLHVSAHLNTTFDGCFSAPCASPSEARGDDDDAHSKDASKQLPLCPSSAKSPSCVSCNP